MGWWGPRALSCSVRVCSNRDGLVEPAGCLVGAGEVPLGECRGGRDSRMRMKSVRFCSYRGMASSSACPPPVGAGEAVAWPGSRLLVEAQGAGDVVGVPLE